MQPKTLLTATMAVLFIQFSYALSIENFKIAPYLIKGQSNHASLNFWSNIPMDLKISVSIAGKSSEKKLHLDKHFSNLDLQKIDLGKIPCDSEVQYVFEDQVESEVLRGTLKSFPCSKLETIYIGFMSDTQMRNESGEIRAKQTAQVVSKLQQRFPFGHIINAGDIVQNGGLLSDWYKFFEVSHIYLNNNFLIPAIGNHEYYDTMAQNQTPKFFQQFMRTKNSSTLGMMSFRFGNIQLLVINTNFRHLSDDLINQQWSWLQQELEVAQSLNLKTIITGHHSPYSSSLEHLRSIPRRLRAEFVPLIEKYNNVKLVLTGHLHMYERSLKNNIHYVIAGPSGGINNVISYKNPYRQFILNTTMTFTVLKITENEIYLETYDVTQAVIDSIRIPL